MAGAAPDLPCRFPFVYKGFVHTTCTFLDAHLIGGKPWCSTLTDISSRHVAGQGNWGICKPGCPMPPGKAFVLNCLYTFL